MFCPHCGSSIPDGTNFCPECGARMSSSRTESRQSSSQSYSSAPQTPYSAPSPAPSTGHQGPLQTDRDIAMFIVLSIVTCGIYGYWFIYKLAEDANIVCANDGEETPGLAAYILLSIVTCGIYSYYWTYKVANRLQNNAPRYGITIQEGGSDVLIWIILGFFTCSITTYVAVYILIKNMNSICDAYNQTVMAR